jgi:hypothetical protein
MISDIAFVLKVSREEGGDDGGLGGGRFGFAELD